MHDVLTLNAGSSSLKFALFPLGSWRAGARMRGQIDGLGGEASFSVDTQEGEPLHRETLTGAAAPRDAGSALDVLLHWLAATSARIDIGAVGHRVVHGGTHFCAPTVLDDDVLAHLDSLEPLAPLHQPHN